MTPLKAIREKCLDCSAQQPSEVKHCPVTKCALWPFRLGKNPNIKGGPGNVSNLVPFASKQGTSST